MIKTGDILIAKPFLQDGPFRRSVVYMCEQHDTGCLGFILNKSQGMLLRDIFPHIKNGNFPLFEGGPVSPNQLFYTHTLGNLLSESHHIVDDVYWGGNFFDLSTMIEQGKVSQDQIRFYVGYSGWDNNQLEAEIASDMWAKQQTLYSDLIRTAPQELWTQELLKINPSYKVFTDYSYDPSLN